MAKIIPQVEEATTLSAQDQFLFYSNTKKKTMRVSRNNMLGSPGVASSIPGVSTTDTTSPDALTGLVVTSSTEISLDGTEKVILKAVCNPSNAADLGSYGWKVRRIGSSAVSVVISNGVATYYDGPNGTGNVVAPAFDPIYATTQAAGSIVVISGQNKITNSWEGVAANNYYEVSVCAIDKSGNASGYTVLDSNSVHKTAKDTTAPGVPTGLSASSAIKSVFLNWTNPTDKDLAKINIYRHTANTFASSTLIASIYGNSYTDTTTSQGTTYYYWVKAVDFSGNISSESTSATTTPGQVAATDISSFAVDATKLNTNTIVLQGANIWSGNTTNKTISWIEHTVVYQGASYTISAGSTGNKYVYWKKPNTTYTATDTNPDAATLGNDGFVIATNVGADGNPSGVYDLAWNALANAVIGTAWIQNAAITNAKISELNADKIRTGSITSQVITLDSGGTLKSSGVNTFLDGVGFWLEGGASPKFGIGDLGSANNGYLKFESNALTVKGAINATSGTFGSGLGTANVTGVKVDDKGLLLLAPSGAGNNGRIAGKIDWGTNAFTPNSTSGFYLGGNNDVYRFFIGNTGTDGLGAGADNLYWNGSALIINGSIGGNIRSGTTIGTAGDNTYGLTIQSGFGLRYYTNAGVLTITGGNGNGASNGAQFDLAGNTWENVNRGALVLSAGKPTFPNATFTGTISGTTLTVSGVTNTILVGMTITGSGVSSSTSITAKINATTYTVTPSQTVGPVAMTGNAGLTPGSIHFRTNDELVGLWRANKTFDIYSTVAMSGDLYVGNADPAQAPFKVVSGAVTATGITVTNGTVSGGIVSSTTKIGGASGVLASVIDSTIADDGNIVTPNFDTASKIILDTFSFASKGGQDYISAIKVGTVTWNASTGVIDTGAGKTGVVIYKGGIIGVKDGVATFTLNGTTGAATFAGELSAPSGNIGGWTINASSISGGSVTIDSVGNIRAGKGTYADGNSGFWLGKDTADANKIKFFIGSSTENLKWDGTDLSITGSISANGGDIAGWIIGADNLSKNDVTISSTGFVNLGTGNDIVKLSSVDATYRIWVGDATAASAPFRVSKTGVVTANGAVLDSSSSIGGRTGATISGTINSNGDITTTSFNTSTRQILETFQFPTDDYDGAIKTGNIVLSGSGTISSGTGVIIYRNGIFGANNGAVKFSLDTNGNATFAGQLSAPTGNIGGWTIGNNLLYAGSGYYKVGLEADATLGGISIYAGSSDGSGSKNTALFYVTNNGFVKADYGFIGGAYVQGGVITVNGYDINTFQTYYNGISSNLSHPAFFAGALGSGSPAANYRNAPFYVEKTGALFATSATITGAITATSGFIGTAADGFAINSTYIRKGTKTSYNGAGTGVYIGTDGIGLGTAFTVSSAGELTATSGKIANWTLAASKLSAGNIEIDATNGLEKIQAGPNGQNYVRISSAGIVGVDSVLGTVFNLPTNGAKPTFSSGEITLTKFTVSTSGIIETSSTAGNGSANGQGVRINDTGIKGFKVNDANPVFFLDATNGNITANGGTIGGWTLSSSALSGGNVTISSGGSIYSGKTAYTSDAAGFWLGYTSSAAKLYIGDASTYIKWTGTSLEVKGKITFSDTSNTGLGSLATKSSVDLATAEVTNKSLANVDSTASTKLGTIASNADVTLDKVNGGLQLTGGGLYVDTTAQIRTNNITWTQATSVFTANQSGFFLGDAKAPNGTTTYRFFIGSTGTNGIGGTNYLYWDGSTLKVGGNIIGGTTVGTSSDTGYGLTVYSPYGIRKGRTTAGTDNGVLTFTGGEGNGVDFGAQIDLVGTDFSVGATSSGTGQLALSAGYDLGNQMNTPIDGAIVFRTAREYNDTTATHIGSLRGWIQVDGLFRIYKNPQGSTNGQTRSDAPNTNAGNLQVDNSITIGVDANINPYTSTKIYAASNIALQTDADIIIGNATQGRYLYFGNSDTNLFRSAANTLKTDDDFIAASVTTTSARRTKKNIKSYKQGLNVVQKLKPVSFNRKVDGKDDIGFIAEDVDKILSTVVTKNNKGQTEGIDYSKLTVVLVNAVKELSAEVKELKKKLKNADRN
jgi:hypothetical protein